MSNTERLVGKCDSCNGDLDRVTDTTAHSYLIHTRLDCRTSERDAALARAETLREALDWSMNVDTQATPFGPYWTSWDHKHHCGICLAPPTNEKDGFLHQPDCKWNKAAQLLAATPEPTEEVTA